MAEKTVKTTVRYNPSDQTYTATDYVYDTDTGVTTAAERVATDDEAYYYLRTRPYTGPKIKTYLDYWKDRMDRPLSQHDDNGNPV